MDRTAQLIARPAEDTAVYDPAAPPGPPHLRGVYDGAVEVLEGNWTGTSTVPSRRLYPHQWSWDSAFVSIGLRHVSPLRAQTELETLLAAQWGDGRIPHIVFNPSVPLDAYFPSPDFWRSSTAGRAAGAPRTVQTSGIVQPPVHALAAWLVHRADPGLSRARGFLARVYPRLAAWHRYLLHRRDLGGGGLVSVVHPWEQGMDNAPSWDAPLARVAPAPARSFRRADLDHGAAEDRPTDLDYGRYVRLAADYRDAGYADGRGGFAVEDPSFNALLIASEHALARIARELGATATARHARAERLTAALVERLWDPAEGMFFCRDVHDTDGPGGKHGGSGPGGEHGGSGPGGEHGGSGPGGEHGGSGPGGEHGGSGPGGEHGGSGPRGWGSGPGRGSTGPGGEHGSSGPGGWGSGPGRGSTEPGREGTGPGQGGGAPVRGGDMVRERGDSGPRPEGSGSRPEDALAWERGDSGPRPEDALARERGDSGPRPEDGTPAREREDSGPRPEDSTPARERGDSGPRPEGSALARERGGSGSGGAGGLIRERGVSGLVPLILPDLPREVAAAVVRTLRGPHFGVGTTTRLVPSYDLLGEAFDPHRYWRGPAWFNTAWLLERGLRLHGHLADADALRRAVLDTALTSDFAEYVDPYTGEACGATGFSWTAALTLDLLHQHTATDKGGDRG
ncbi:MGH1-like glycoside hydrolase domain-containing protein [Streptomyces sp. YKOK-I1]